MCTRGYIANFGPLVQNAPVAQWQCICLVNRRSRVRSTPGALLFVARSLDARCAADSSGRQLSPAFRRFFAPRQHAVTWHVGTSRSSHLVPVRNAFRARSPNARSQRARHRLASACDSTVADLGCRAPAHMSAALAREVPALLHRLHMFSERGPPSDTTCSHRFGLRERDVDRSCSSDSRDGDSSDDNAGSDVDGSDAGSLRSLSPATPIRIPALRRLFRASHHRQQQQQHQQQQHSLRRGYGHDTIEMPPAAGPPMLLPQPQPLPPTGRRRSRGATAASPCAAQTPQNTAAGESFAGGAPSFEGWLDTSLWPRAPTIMSHPGSPSLSTVASVDTLAASPAWDAADALFPPSPRLLALTSACATTETCARSGLSPGRRRVCRARPLAVAPAVAEELATPRRLSPTSLVLDSLGVARSHASPAADWPSSERPFRLVDNPQDDPPPNHRLCPPAVARGAAVTPAECVLYTFIAATAESRSPRLYLVTPGGFVRYVQVGKHNFEDADGSTPGSLFSPGADPAKPTLPPGTGWRSVSATHMAPVHGRCASAAGVCVALHFLTNVRGAAAQRSCPLYRHGCPDAHSNSVDS
jgi:hypothetical protein